VSLLNMLFQLSLQLMPQLNAPWQFKLLRASMVSQSEIQSKPESHPITLWVTVQLIQQERVQPLFLKFHASGRLSLELWVVAIRTLASQHLILIL
jgi:hypothetical protein